MFCVKCGTKMEVDAKFCSSCGTSVAVNNVPDVEEEDTWLRPKSTGDIHVDMLKSRARLIITIIAIIIALAVVGYIFDL